MGLSAKQKEAVELYRREEQEYEWCQLYKYRATYIAKYMSDIGPTKIPEVDERLDKIRVLAREIGDILEGTLI